MLRNFLNFFTSLGRLEDEYFNAFFYNKQRFTEADNRTLRYALLWSENAYNTNAFFCSTRYKYIITPIPPRYDPRYFTNFKRYYSQQVISKKLTSTKNVLLTSRNKKLCSSTVNINLANGALIKLLLLNLFLSSHLCG